MARIPIALQLYSVREDAARDLQAVLAAVADMGYEGVEFAGYYGHDARTIRSWLDAYGLKVAGAHHDGNRSRWLTAYPHTSPAARDGCRYATRTGGQ